MNGNTKYGGYEDFSGNVIIQKKIKGILLFKQRDKRVKCGLNLLKNIEILSWLMHNNKMLFQLENKIYYSR